MGWVSGFRVGVAWPRMEGTEDARTRVVNLNLEEPAEGGSDVFKRYQLHLGIKNHRTNSRALINRDPDDPLYEVSSKLIR